MELYAYRGEPWSPKGLYKMERGWRGEEVDEYNFFVRLSEGILCVDVREHKQRVLIDLYCFMTRGC